MEKLIYLFLAVCGIACVWFLNLIMYAINTMVV